MKSRIHLTQTDKERIFDSIKTKLACRSEFIFAYLFGSATDELNVGDIDIAVYFRDQIPQDEQTDFTLYLSTELSHELGLPVDVRPLNHTSAGFRFHVTDGHVLFSYDEDTRLDFVESTWREYHDFKPLMEQNLKDLLEI
jgi:hypothetical protein